MHPLDSFRNIDGTDIHLVIGGGPSGLVTLKYLATAHEFFENMKPIDAMLFEAESSLGGTFRHRAYENAEVSRLHEIEIHLTA